MVTPDIAVGDPYAEEERVHLPVVPWQVPFIPPAPAPLFQGNQCGGCGISLDGVIGYVCPRLDCPIQPRIITYTW